MVTCSVYGCTSTTTLNKDLRFHRFPRNERCHSWIDACRRPDLKDKNIEQLYNLYVCSLHFEKWMYMNMKLKDAAIPVLNLPRASIHPMSTQTEAPRIVTKDLHSIGIQTQVDVSSVVVSVAASTSVQESQTTKKLTDHSPRKRKLRNEIKKCAKKLKLFEDAKSMDVTRQQFLLGCDKFLSPNLSKIVKAQVNLKPHFTNN